MSLGDSPKPICDLFSNKFDEEIKQLNEKIYYVNEKKNIKKTILKNLENQLIQNKP